MPPARICRYCPAPTRPHPQAVTCGAATCKKQHHRDRCRRQQQRLRAEAAERGESYRGRWGWQRYGNARKRVIAVGDAIAIDKLGERDGWVCGLCARPVDQTVRYPDLLSPSIDHITPLARGGTHTWDNVQIAHYRCNVSKKANTEWTPRETA